MASYFSIFGRVVAWQDDFLFAGEPGQNNIRWLKVQPQLQLQPQQRRSMMLYGLLLSTSFGTRE
jgi:hypothetical protein